MANSMLPGFGALRRRLITVLAATVAATGTVVLLPTTATAAPHYTRPPSIQIGHTDSINRRTAYDLTPEVSPPLGAWRDDRGRRHISRVYATFDLTQLVGRGHIDTTLYLRETDVVDCSKRAIEVWRTRTVTRTPSWSTAPEAVRKQDEILTSGFCPTDLGFDVSEAVDHALAHGRTRVTLEIRVPRRHEHDLSYGRKLYWYTGVFLNSEYNSAPSIVAQHRYNGGFPCAATAPYPVLGGFVGVLQALANDPDPDDLHRQHYDFAVWPQDDPTARTERGYDFGSTDRVATVTMPDNVLADGRTYSWQARTNDGVAISPWSEPCHFTVDRTRPAAPTIALDPPQLGEPLEFTFSANGNTDTLGFGYSWGGPSVRGCSYGELGRLICLDPFDEPNTVRADAPGGTATVRLNAPGSGPSRLTVYAIDAAGNRSQHVQHEFFPPFGGRPTITPVGDVRWNQPVTLTLTPSPLITGTTHFEYQLDGDDPRSVPVDANGTATVTFLADNEFGHEIRVRSHSASGWVSPEVSWHHFFDPWPTVRSDVYPDTGEPSGGVGVPGTFTFFPPESGWPTVHGYNYTFDLWSGEYTFVPADPDGTATITWAPTAPGDTTLVVYPVRPDGSIGDHNAFHSFYVAD